MDNTRIFWGVVHSLFYKHQHKRVFAKTFGLPVNIGILVGLVLMLVAFEMM